MRIIYILIFTAVISIIFLWLGCFNKVSKRTAALTTTVCITISGILLLLAVLPENSFYGSVLTHAENTQNRKIIALTFDDGPYPPYTQELLDLLEKKQVSATFFFVGENAAEHPDIVKTAQNKGHLIALHAGYHKDLLKLTAEQTQENINFGKKTLETITAAPLHYMRPPHGFKDWSTVHCINNAGLQIVNWNIIPRDWTNPGAEIIADRVCKAASPGSIILLHDGDSPKKTASRKQTIEAVSIIIDCLRQQGYEFVTVEEIADINNQL